MLRKFYRDKGQGVSAEYVILIALTSIAIVSMTVYVRRALQARYRDGNRMVYQQASAALGNEVQIEYEPYYLNTQSMTDSSTLVDERISGNALDRTDSMDRSVSTHSTQTPFF